MSLLNTPIGDFSRKVANVLGWLGGIAGGFIVIKSYLNLPKDVGEQITHVAFVTFFAVILAGTIWREFITAKKEKYANVTNQFSAAIGTANEFSAYCERSRQMDIHNSERFEDFQSNVEASITRYLDHVATVYRMVTGTYCRASIKLVQNIDGRAILFCLGRDSTSREAHLESDQNRYRNREDPIEDNEDFEILYSNEPDEGFYFENNLPRRYKKYGYKSSSENIYRRSQQANTLKRIFRFVDYPYPYRSTIVWPIRLKKSASLPVGDGLCLGFLTIDSEATGVFSKRWDVPIGKAFAAAIYQPLAQAIDITEQQGGGPHDGQENHEVQSR